MYQIYVYAPIKDAEKVKNAMHIAGAGKIGDYAFCSWQSLGQGQYLPLEGSNPSIGQQNRLEKVDELKIEMVCEDKYLKVVLKAMLKTHPYEEPAYGFIKIGSISDL